MEKNNIGHASSFSGGVLTTAILLLVGVVSAFFILLINDSPKDEFRIHQAREFIDVEEPLDDEFLVVAESVPVAHGLWVVQVRREGSKMIYNSLSSRPLSKGDQVYVKILSYTMTPDFQSTIYVVVDE